MTRFGTFIAVLAMLAALAFAPPTSATTIADVGNAKTAAVENYKPIHSMFVRDAIAGAGSIDAVFVVDEGGVMQPVCIGTSPAASTTSVTTDYSSDANMTIDDSGGAGGGGFMTAAYIGNTRTTRETGAASFMLARMRPAILITTLTMFAIDTTPATARTTTIAC